MSEKNEPFGFTTTIPVRISDINYGDHVGHDSLISILHEARMQYLDLFGCDELHIFGKGSLITEFNVKYKQIMYYGDELRIKLVATAHGKTSFKIDYEVFVKNSLAATAQSISTFYDYETQKICRMPQDFRDIIENKLVSAID